MPDLALAKTALAVSSLIPLGIGNMKRILSTALLAAGALAAFPSFAANSLNLHSAATGNNYVAYYDQKTPSDAQNFCISKGGHLAVFNNHAEIVDVSKVLDLNTAYNYWLGEYAPHPFSSGIKSTVTGQAYYQDPAYTYQTTTNQLENYDGYLMYTPDTSGGTADFFQWAVDQTAGFICEFEDAPI